jgi:hypothetical protein
MRGQAVDIVADVPAQNTIRIWRDTADGMWVARIGPEHASVEFKSSSPDRALMLLQLKMKQGRYKYDTTMRSL